MISISSWFSLSDVRARGKGVAEGGVWRRGVNDDFLLYRQRLMK